MASTHGPLVLAPRPTRQVTEKWRDPGCSSARLGAEPAALQLQLGGGGE
jgi:hypothetical protein